MQGGSSNNSSSCGSGGGSTQSKVSVQFCAFDRFSRVGGAPECAGPVHTKSFCRQRIRTTQPMTAGAAAGGVRHRTCNSNINSSNSNSSNRPMPAAAAAGDSSSTGCPTLSAASRDRGFVSPDDGSSCSCDDDPKVNAAASTTIINGATNRIYAADGDKKAKARQHQATVIRIANTSGDSSQQQITLVEGRRVYVVDAAPWPRQPRELLSEQYKSYRTRWSQAELRRIRELAGKRREAAEALRRERESRRFRQPVYCLPRDLLSDSKARLMRWFKLDDEDQESLGRIQ